MLAEQSEKTYGGNIGGYMSDGEPLMNKRSSAGRVTEEYGSLDKGLAVLGEAIEQLQQKLEPVLSPPVPRPDMAGDAQKMVRELLSPLGESLRSESERVRRYTRNVQELLERIEV